MKIEVLDKGYVELIDTLPKYTKEWLGEEGNSPLSSLDYRIVEAARTSHANGRKTPAQDKKLIKYLWENHHTSPFEQVEFQFLVKAPVVVWWQWVRHRMAEYNLQSGRYTEYDDDEFFIPDTWRLQSKTNKQGGEGFLDSDIQQELGYRLDRTIQQGLENYHYALQCRSSREDARFFLPAWLLYHTGMVKMNLHALLNFLYKRNDSHAQWTIRAYAQAMNEIFMSVAPTTHRMIFG